MSDTDKKLDRIERKLDSLEDIETTLETVVKNEKGELNKIEKEEVKIEKDLIRIGNFSLKRSRVLDLARGVAGAALGVGLGQALGISVTLAKKIPWLNAIGLLIFIILLAGVLIYKNEKTLIEGTRKHPLRYIGERIAMLYTISVIIEFIGLILFNNYPGWDATLAKALVVGSFPAMSSAAAFSIL